MRTRVAAAVAALVCLATGCSRSRNAPPIPPKELDIATRPAAAWLSEEPIRLLRDYVRIDTTADRGELEGIEFLRRVFECEGIPTEVICPAPKRCNLFARLPGRRRDGALLLLNHVDVAPAWPGTWKEAPPFEGRIKAGYLYGRGVYDMKSIAIAQALAMRHLKRNGIVPPSDVLFLGEADEEIGQKWGSRWLLEHRPDLFEGVSAVLNEGGVAEMVLREVRFWGIETVQAGYSTATFDSATADKLETLGAKFRKLDGPAVEPIPQVVEGFNLLANHLVSPLTDPLRHLDRVRRDPAELAILPDRYGAFLEPRVFWSPIFPSPPGTVGHRRYVVVSTPPGIPPARYFDPILAEALRLGVKVDLVIAGEETKPSPYPTPFTELIRRVTEGRFPGVPFGPVPTAGSYSSSEFFRRKGLPTYGFPAVPTNITDAARRHGRDERIYLPDFLAGGRLYSDLLEEFALPAAP